MGIPGKVVHVDEDSEICGIAIGTSIDNICGQQRRLLCNKNTSDGDGMLDSKGFENYLDQIIANLPEEKRNHFGYIDSLFFNLYIVGKNEKIFEWIKSQDIFSKDYVVIPIVIWLHWRVLILCNFSKVASRLESPCMILLDSLQAMEQSIETEIRKFVAELLRTNDMSVDNDLPKVAPLLIPKVPQQRGGEECGWYNLMYCKLFMENAPQIFKIEEYPYFVTKQWFNLQEFNEFKLSLLNRKMQLMNSGSILATPTIEGSKDDENIDDGKQEIDGEAGNNESDEERYADSEYGISDEDENTGSLIKQTMVESMIKFEEHVSIEVTKIWTGEEHSTLQNNKDEVTIYVGTSDFHNDRGKEEHQLKNLEVEKQEKQVVNPTFVATTEQLNLNTKKNRRGGIKGQLRKAWLLNDVQEIEMEMENEKEFTFDTDDEDSSDNFFDSHSSSNEENGSLKRKPKCERFNRKKHGDDPIFKIGLIFGSKGDVRAAILNHGIKKGREIYFEKNDKVRVRAKCHGEKCEWYIYARRMSDTPNFQITAMKSEHSCSRTLNHKLATARWIATKYIDEFRTEKGVHLVELKDKLHRELNVNVSMEKLRRTKKEAKRLIEGHYREQYKLLWNYKAELLRSNPGSTVFIEHKMNEETSELYFARMYVCFSALRQGFMDGCRRVLCLDGTFLKGPHQGVLLTAVGMDANNGIYPVVYAVVEGENKITWKWFLGTLIQDLQINEPKEWCFMSDRQKGLVPAIGDLLPGIEHRHCLRHLHNNMKQKYPGDAIKEMIWICAKATYEAKFDAEMVRLKAIDDGAFQWLKNNTQPRYWSRAHFRDTVKCDILLNNHSESFNNTILLPRSKPILGLLEGIRVYLMLRQQQRRLWIEKQQGSICPRIFKRLEKLKEESSHCYPSFAGGRKFEVRDSRMEKFSVDLGVCSCSCRKWQLSGIPCTHAIAALGLEGTSPEGFVDTCYSIDAYKRAYEPIICPTNGPNNWPKSDMIPLSAPPVIRMPGRPKKKRKLEIGEVGSRVNSEGGQRMARKGLTSMTCKACGEKGHNVRSCAKKAETGKEGLNVNKCGLCGEMGHNRRSCEMAREVQQKDDAYVSHEGQESQQITDSVAAQIAEEVERIEESLQLQNHDQTLAPLQVEIQPQKQKKPRRPSRCGWCGQTGHNRSKCKVPGAFFHPKLSYMDALRKLD